MGPNYTSEVPKEKKLTVPSEADEWRYTPRQRPESTIGIIDLVVKRHSISMLPVREAC